MFFVARFIFFSFFITKVLGNSVIECPSSSGSTTYSKLKSSLLCDYDPLIRPVVNHQNATSVAFRFILKFFQYEPYDGTFSIDAWLKVSWADQHLRWNPEKYDKIDKLYLDTLEIWIPDLSVYNTAEQGGDPSVIGSTQCTVSSKGSVVCVPSLHVDTLCVPDMSMYPFDSQSCSIRLGSWVYKGEELDFRIPKDAIITSSLEANGEWVLDNYAVKKYPGKYKCCPNVTYPSFEIVFNISRLHGSHTATAVFPTLVVTILTFTCLSTSPLNQERLVLSYVNVIAHLLHVQFLSFQLPLRGDRMPFLLVFARDSLLLSAILVAFSIIFKNLMQRKSVAPLWISRFVSVVISCPPGQYLFVSDNSTKGIASPRENDGTNLIDMNQRNVSDWEIFVRILDFILLVDYTITYFKMAITFIP